METENTGAPTEDPNDVFITGSRGLSVTGSGTLQIKYFDSSMVLECDDFAGVDSTACHIRSLTPRAPAPSALANLVLPLIMALTLVS